MSLTTKAGIKPIYNSLKEMFKLMEDRKLFIALSFFEILRGFWMLQGEAWGIKWIGDGIIQHNGALLLRGMIVLSVTVSLSVISVYLIEHTSQKIAIRTKSTLRKHLLEAVLASPAAHSEGLQSGDLLYRLTNHVEDLARLYRSVYFFIGSIGKVTSTLVVGFVFSWELSIVVLALGALKIWADKTLIKRLQEIIRKIKLLESGLLVEVQEYITGSTFFRMFGNEKKVTHHFIRANQQFGEENLKEAAVHARTNSIMKVFEFLTILTILALGSFLVMRGQLTAGALAAFLALHDNLTNPYRFIGNFLKQYQSFSVSYERLQEVFDLCEESGVPVAASYQGCDNVLMQPFTLRVKDLTFGYSAGRKVVENLNLEVPSGEITYLVGKSGAGKSTLFKLLLGLYRPAHGTVELLSVDEGSKPVERELFTYVSQHAFLFNGTISENIALHSEGVDQKRVVEAAKQAGIHDFIATLPEGYATVLTDGGNRLSGGQRCRIALARAFYRPTPIILLDEVFAPLDNNTIAEIRHSIENLCAENRCVLMISHRHEWIPEEGRVVEIA